MDDEEPEFSYPKSNLPQIETSEEELLALFGLSSVLRVKTSTSVDQVKSLSLMNLVLLLHDTNPEELDTFIRMVMNYDMVVARALEGWKGIDSKLCIKLLHLACEWKSDRIRLPDRKFNATSKSRLNPSEKIIILYYQAIWQYYSSFFKERVPYILTIEKKLLEVKDRREQIRD